MKIFSADPAIPGRLLDYQEALLRDIRDTFDTIKNQDVSARLKPEDLPPAIRSRFVSVDGKNFASWLFPRKTSGSTTCRKSSSHNFAP